MADSFKFELVSPERLLVSEDVESVVIPGSDGEMTVMAHHSPVMSTMKPGVVTVGKSGGQTDRYVVYGGFADVLPESCTLLAESATSVADLDPADVAQRVQNAREDVADAKDAEAKASAEAMLSHLELLEKAVSGAH